MGTNVEQVDRRNVQRRAGIRFQQEVDPRVRETLLAHDCVSPGDRQGQVTSRATRARAPGAVGCFSEADSPP